MSKQPEALALATIQESIMESLLKMPILQSYYHLPKNNAYLINASAIFELPSGVKEQPTTDTDSTVLWDLSALQSEPTQQQIRYESVIRLLWRAIPDEHGVGERINRARLHREVICYNDDCIKDEQEAEAWFQRALELTL